MANGKINGVPLGPRGALKRPDYHPDQYLCATDLGADQRYLVQRWRRQRRYLHGWGVVCGLKVAPANDPLQPWGLWVCPGYAIGPYGDEILVECRRRIDVIDFLWTRPANVALLSRMAFVGIRYAEKYLQPVPARAPKCGCDDEAEKPSRIEDGFEIEVLWSLPPRVDGAPFDLCQPSVAACPRCSESPFVILASVTLPFNHRDPIMAEVIDNSPVKA
jgi:hypothetical protein